MEKAELYELVFGENYYGVEDLRYNQKFGFLFSQSELEQFLDEKDNLIAAGEEHIECLPLKTFNSRYCFYVEGVYLLKKHKEYLSTLIEDYDLYHKPLFHRNAEDMIMSRVFSETEGSVNLENVGTTHKRIKEIYQKKELTDRNDVIIHNMLSAMRFIAKEKPAFNKENLFKLYGMLSRGCLDEEDRLKEGAYYRDDSVYVGEFQGAPASEIEACMDSLFAFVNDPANVKKYDIFLPHICHYYILYVHPYFDYNGRTARMVSFWLNLLFEIKGAPLFMSEAINDHKKEYYRAIVNTRLARNDLTYFIGYILQTATQYSLLYKNLENIRERLSRSGDALTSAEMMYLKKILVHALEGYFHHKEFLEFIRPNTMTKAGALKVLNSLEGYGILEKRLNKKREAVFRVRQDAVTYRYHG